MKKYVGRNESGETVYYEEVKNVRDIERIEGEWKEDVSNGISNANLWMTANWNSNMTHNLITTYLLFYTIMLPFVVLRGCFSEEKKIAYFCRLLVLTLFLYMFGFFSFGKKEVLPVKEEVKVVLKDSRFSNKKPGQIWSREGWVDYDWGGSLEERREEAKKSWEE